MTRRKKISSILKTEILKASSMPGAKLSRIAKIYDVSVSTIRTWQNNQLIIYIPDTPNTSDIKIGKNYKLGGLSITGNIVPTSWYHIITLTNTKPDQIGITILSELLTQHDVTGELRLAMSYKYFKKKFNLTKVQIRGAIVRLEEKNLIKRDFETVEEQGRKMPNQMFLNLNKEKLKVFCNN